MTYTPQTWTDGSGGGTPLSAARLTHIEDGMVAHDVDISNKMNAADEISLAQYPAGAMIAIDYFKSDYGAANAWPTSRPSADTTLCFVWIGPTDPGTIMVAGDAFWLDPS